MMQPVEEKDEENADEYSNESEQVSEQIDTQIRETVINQSDLIKFQRNTSILKPKSKIAQNMLSQEKKFQGSDFLDQQALEADRITFDSIQTDASPSPKKKVQHQETDMSLSLSVVPLPENTTESEWKDSSERNQAQDDFIKEVDEDDQSSQDKKSSNKSKNAD